jgi:hypothetical protein
LTANSDGGGGDRQPQPSAPNASIIKTGLGLGLKTGLQPRAGPRVFNELPAMYSSSSRRSASPLPSSDIHLRTLPMDMQALVQVTLSLPLL